MCHRFEMVSGEEADAVLDWLRAVRRALAALLPGCGLLHRGALPRWQRSARANYVFETTQERDKYLKRDYCAPTPAQRCKPYFDAVRGLDEPTAVQWVDWQTWLPRDILRKADRMSMAHSLELRVPFLDRQVLAAAQTLPRRYRCTGRRGKIALRAAAAPSEIDLRGMMTDEAIAVLDRFLDTAMMGKLESVTIIHGKGTGAVRKAVREHLKRSRYIKSFRPGRYGEGEDGVTIVALK